MKANNLLLRMTALAALSHCVSSFSPLVARKPVVTPSVEQSLLKNAYQNRGNTAQFMLWSGKDEPKNESEGKRDAESRLKLSGIYTSEASLPDFLTSFPSTQSIEEFVEPVTNALDNTTGGWALSYANLDPEDETTPIGMSFLATNLAYGIAGSLLVTQGNAVLGVLTEIACLASFLYHFSQLKLGQSGFRIVRLALLVDYFFAVSAIIVGSIQLFFSHQIPTEVLFGGSLAVASLGACWLWEEGLTYIVFHSLWHLFSAYTGYVIGSSSSV